MRTSRSVALLATTLVLACCGPRPRTALLPAAPPPGPPLRDAGPASSAEDAPPPSPPRKPAPARREALQQYLDVYEADTLHQDYGQDFAMSYDDGDVATSIVGPAHMEFTRSTRRLHFEWMNAGVPHGQVDRYVEPGTIAIEPSDWHAYALAAEEYPGASQPTPARILVPSTGGIEQGILTVTRVREGVRLVTLKIGSDVTSAEILEDGRVLQGTMPGKNVVAVPRQEQDVMTDRTPEPPGSKNTTRLFTLSRPRTLLYGYVTEPKVHGPKLPIAVIASRRKGWHVNDPTNFDWQIEHELGEKGIATLVFQRFSTEPGDSSPAPPSYLAADTAACVAAMRESKRYSDVSLVGYDEGAFVALSVPEIDRLEGLVLLNAPGWSTALGAEVDALLRTVKAPVAILQGDVDRGGLAYAQKLAASHPNVRVVTVAHATWAFLDERTIAPEAAYGEPVPPPAKFSAAAIDAIAREVGRGRAQAR